MSGKVLELCSVASLCLFLGCASIDMRVGRRPDVRALESRLEVGRSSSEDVLAILGTPTGGGRSRLPIIPATQKVWTYYYEKGQVEGLTVVDDRRLFLFVFLEEGTYAGYMWFSSLREHGGR